MSALPVPAPVNPLALSALPSPVWRAGRHDPPAPAGESSGFAALDAVLPGSGWPAGCLTELLCREAGIGELRLLVPLLQRLTQQRRFVILLAPPHIPYAPALASFTFANARGPRRFRGKTLTHAGGLGRIVASGL